MKRISRLPVQHPAAPHCPTCKKDLPTLDGLSVDLPRVEEKILQLVVIARIQCACGAIWDLHKKTIVP